MDLTGTFREAVAKMEEVATVTKGDQVKQKVVRDRKRILNGPTEGGAVLEKRARSVAGHIGQLREFLVENREEYLNVVSSAAAVSEGGLSDVQRDKIDAGANNFIRTANSLISKFKDDLQRFVCLSLVLIEVFNANVSFVTAEKISTLRVAAISRPSLTSSTGS